MVSKPGPIKKVIRCLIAIIIMPIIIILLLKDWIFGYDTNFAWYELEDWLKGTWEEGSFF